MVAGKRVHAIEDDAGGDPVVVRELEGAITRLYATWQYMRTSITPDVAETVIRDLVQGLEPRRIKIEDILRIISRHYGVSKCDILSQRRHRSGLRAGKHRSSSSMAEKGHSWEHRPHWVQPE